MTVTTDTWGRGESSWRTSSLVPSESTAKNIVIQYSVEEDGWRDDFKAVIGSPQEPRQAASLP